MQSIHKLEALGQQYKQVSLKNLGGLKNSVTNISYAY